jgi:outer membrane protein
MKTVCRIGLVLLVCSAVVTASAAELEFQLTPTEIPALKAGEVWELDLDEAYRVALNRNLDLQIGRYDLAVSETGILGASGIFDPSLDFGVNGSYNKSASASQLDGAAVREDRSTRYNLGLSSFLPTGGQASLQFVTSRFETNNQFVNLNPNWSSSFGANFSQPLLRNFGTLVNRSGIVIAHTNRDQSVEALKLQVIATLRLVESSYWDFVAAQVTVEVAEQSLALAQRLLDETQERVRVGTSAPIDLVQSEAGVATRRQDLIVARNDRDNKEDALKKVLGFATPAEWAITIKTVEPYGFVPLEVDLAGAINEALSKRPEVRQRTLSADLAELRTELARNAVLPELTLDASYGFAGLGGTVLSEDPVTGELVTVRGGLGDSLDQITDFDSPSWTLGVNLKVPIGNNDAKATLAQRRFEEQREALELRSLQQDITHQVRLAVRALHDGAANVDAAESSRELQERNVEAEQTKFQNGLSTNFQVLQVQDQLANAQEAEIRARLNYRKSLVEYRVATGTLLPTLDVRVTDPGAPEEAHSYWKDVGWMQFIDFKGADLAEDGDGEDTDDEGEASDDEE